MLQRANMALVLAAALTAGCGQVQDILDTIAEGSDQGAGHGGGHHPPPPPPPSNCGLIDVDQLYQRVASDLASLDADDQPFARYLSLANRSNAGVCGAALDADREALSELVNSLSIDASITRPVAIDSGRLLFRLDERDYGWDRSIEIEGQSFSDAWEAALSRSPFAVEYAGDDADSAKGDTGTSVPVLSFDAFATVAAAAPLYYALLQIPDTSDELLLDVLAIDVDANIADGDGARAGTTKSRISRFDRLAERYAIEVRSGAFWRALDFSDEVGSSTANMFEDPLTLESAGSVAFFTLPNGLFGFGIFDQQGNTVADSDILLDTNQNNFRAQVAVSCLNCHGRSGVLPVVDEVRPVVEANADNLDPDLVASVQRLYPSPDEFAAIGAADSDVFLSALARAGVSAAADRDPLAAALTEFDRDVLPPVMAGDLYVSPDFLQSNLELLPELFSVAALDRDDYATAYFDAACVLGVVAENIPVGCQ